MLLSVPSMLLQGLPALFALLHNVSHQVIGIISHHDCVVAGFYAHIQVVGKYILLQKDRLQSSSLFWCAAAVS